MNPFSGFLQPQNNRPLEGLATAQDVLRVVQGNKEMAQRQLENTQQNDRANQRFAMEKAYQDRKFTQDDQKQVEALLAEYQDAEDQGDPVRLSRAAQMLKRFGMDVAPGGQSGAPPANLHDFNGAKPDLRALTGERALPNVTPKATPDDATIQALTGQAPQDLSQEEWEKQFTADKPETPQQEATEPDIAAHLRSVGPLKALKLNTPEEQQASAAQPVDMGDVDSPEFQQAAAQEGTNGGVIDLDAEDPTPLKIGQPQTAPEPQQAPRRLSTQLLPTVVSKGGKQLYESTGPSGRWTPMVSGVFDQFTTHENPEIASAAKRAQAMATKLIGVDGVAPKEAISIGMDYLNKEASRAIALERTKLGSRRGLGGGGAASGGFRAMGKREDTAESINVYIGRATTILGALNKSDQLLAQAEALANSSDPALQRNAIDVLVQSRSGATVSDRERARYDQLDGVLSQAQNYLARWTGGPLDPEYVNKIKMVIAEQRRINASTRDETAADLEEAYTAQNEGKVDEPILQKRKGALGKVIRRSESPTGTVEGGGFREEDAY